jgi:hypothetical protein
MDASIATPIIGFAYRVRLSTMVTPPGKVLRELRLLAGTAEGMRRPFRDCFHYKIEKFDRQRDVSGLAAFLD